jgi:hypothetical protein
MTARTARPPLLITKAFVTVPTVAPRLIVIKPVQFGLHDPRRKHSFKPKSGSCGA